jgi:tetratricopeptide (TPR) repeat protein
MKKPVSLLAIAIAVLLAGFFLQSLASPSNKASEAARLNNLGAAYMNQQFFEKALKAFQEAAEADPKLEIARLNQGIALLNLAKIDPAEQALQAAVKENPKDARGWYNLGLLYKNSSSPERAVEAFRHVIEIDPNDADTWYFLGSVYSQIKQFPQALDAFQQALKLNPLHASAEFGMSRAYQQSGDMASARQHLQRFQYVTQNKLGAPISLAYGEQGKYSQAEESPMGVLKPLAEIPVQFVDVTKSAGLAASSNVTQQSNAALPGACFLDYDDDGKPDIFLADGGPVGGMALYRNLGAGKFEDVTKQAGLKLAAHASGCSAGDFDNDGAIDLVVSSDKGVLLLRNEKNGKFKDVTEAAGIKSRGLSLGVTFIDYDHDGDIDLYVVRGGSSNDSSNMMWRNNGNGTFTDVTDSLNLGNVSGSLGSIGSDYNDDRAVDLVVTGSAGPAIFENPREGKFPIRRPWPALATAATVGVAVLDFDHDQWMDLAFTYSQTPGLRLLRNEQGKGFSEVTLPVTNWVRGWGVAAVDYDNDGWVDLIAVGETRDGKGEIRLFRNLGPDGFKDVTADVGLDKISLKDPRSVITADYNEDGATDLLITQNQGSAILLKNEGGNKNNWLRLRLKGLNDNKSAIGTKIEVFSGGNRQKFELAGSSGYLGQNSTDLVVGLGEAKDADIVRMLWPTGVLQDEIQIAGNREQPYLEMDRRGSSCPTLFAWDGQKYALVGDMLGAGVVGHWVGPGERNIPRPTEYIKLNRASLATRDGKLSFRFMEPLEEAVYLDQVRLVAVDHPSDLDVFPNEYFASSPPYPSFKVVFSQNAKPPAGAWDEHGHNVLPDLLANRYFGDFKVSNFLGFAEKHTLELDLGEAYTGGPLWLLMHGEIEYFSANSMYAASQAGLNAVAPYVEAQAASGKWIRVTDDLGFPAGGPRTMTADLTDKLPNGTRRIRLTTNLQIYWDKVLIDRTTQDQPFHLNDVPLSAAKADFHGFPLKIEGNPPGNVQYFYENASATGPYTRPAGSYTRYGNVKPLLASLDDKLAVFGSGDEIALDFDPTTLPAVPSGWVRDYFFVANGYEKYMDFYAAHFDTVAPMPFGSMKSYPYQDQTFPIDDEHLRYFLEYNTRQMSGNEASGYAFSYSK